MTIRQYLASIGRKGGAATRGVTSAAKKLAARANGKKGGRPRGRYVTRRFFCEPTMTVKQYLASIGRKGGRAKSPAKTAAARANAKRPRPRKPTSS